jgi:hypothetical protein
VTRNSLKNASVGARRWLARVVVPIFRKLVEPTLHDEAVVLDDYLRIQNLRRIEEERFRHVYLGRFHV